MVLVRGIEKGLKLYKEEMIIRLECASKKVFLGILLSEVYFMLQGLCL